MIEGDVAVFLLNENLRARKRLKGIISYSDDLLPEIDRLFWYNFPTTRKPSDEFLRLLTGK